MRLTNITVKKLLDEINEYNGEVLTLEEKKSREKLEILKGEYADLGQITESGCYYMYNTVKDRYEQVAVVVDETTGDIVAVHNNTRNETTSAWNEVGEAAKKMAQKEDAAFKLVVGAHMKYNASSGTVIDEVGEAAKKMAQKEDAAFKLVVGAHMKYNASSGTVIDSATGIEYALKDVQEQADGTRT